MVPIVHAIGSHPAPLETRRIDTFLAVWNIATTVLKLYYRAAQGSPPESNHDASHPVKAAAHSDDCVQRSYMQRRILSCAMIAVSLVTCRYAVAQDGDAASHAAAGEHLFKQYCSACHSTEPGKKIVGPSLHAEMKGASPRKTTAEVKTTIMNGNGTMPAFKTQLAPTDIDNLVAYLKTQ